MGTQWNWAGMDGARVGLKYEALEPTARIARIDVTPRVFADLKVIEREALGFLRERERAERA